MPGVSLADIHATTCWFMGMANVATTALQQEHQQSIACFLAHAPVPGPATGCFPWLWSFRSASFATPLASARQMEHQVEYLETAQEAAAAHKCECNWEVQF